MRKALIVIGYQPEKLKKCGLFTEKKLTSWIQANQHLYDYTIGIFRDTGNRNLDRSKTNGIIRDDIHNSCPFTVDKEIHVGGFDVDADEFSMDTEYHIVGISTAASVMCIALSLYSAGINIKILTSMCFDRCGCHKEAVKIMNAYMSECVLD